jgi:hypothetical protein
MFIGGLFLLTVWYYESIIGTMELQVIAQPLECGFSGKVSGLPGGIGSLKRKK